LKQVIHAGWRSISAALLGSESTAEGLPRVAEQQCATGSAPRRTPGYARHIKLPRVRTEARVKSRPPCLMAWEWSQHRLSLHFRKPQEAWSKLAGAKSLAVRLRVVRQDSSRLRHPQSTQHVKPRVQAGFRVAKSACCCALNHGHFSTESKINIPANLSGRSDRCAR